MTGVQLYREKVPNSQFLFYCLVFISEVGMEDEDDARDE